MSRIHLRSTIPILRVTNIDAALPTYTALGFTVAWQHQLDPAAPRLTAVAQGKSELYLTEHPVVPAGAAVYFVVQGVDALRALAERSGVHPSFGPENRPWGTREVYFTDHDGNVLRFGEPLP